MKRALLALLLPTTLIVAPLSAHEGHAHKVMGVVAAIDATHLEVKGTDGKTVSLVLNQKTTVRRGKAPAALADIAIGSRVVVTTMEEGGVKRVTDVQLPEASEPGSAPRKK